MHLLAELRDSFPNMTNREVNMKEFPQTEELRHKQQIERDEAGMILTLTEQESLRDGEDSRPQLLRRCISR